MTPTKATAAKRTAAKQTTPAARRADDEQLRMGVKEAPEPDRDDEDQADDGQAEAKAADAPLSAAERKELEALRAAKRAAEQPDAPEDKPRDWRLYLADGRVVEDHSGNATHYHDPDTDELVKVVDRQPIR